MIVGIPFEGRLRTILHSPYLIAQRVSASLYNLSGETFSMTELTSKQIIILPDEVEISEGETLTHETMMKALPIETFISASAEEALADALGLVLRSCVADGTISDAELLRVQPALEGRLWQPNLDVLVGDVYTFGACIWRCIQAHRTQGDWSPDMTPALWRKVEVVDDSAVNVWQSGVDYLEGDIRAYPDAESTLYECLQAHSSQDGWEPPSVPALWVVRETGV